MLTITQSKSVSGTQHYFDEALTRGDYYTGQEVAGRWHGKGTQLLGIQEGSEVTREQFNRLLEGNHPTLGEQLAQRNRSDRRPGVDMTFSVPKSVSLAWAINGDERIIAAMQKSVQETMQNDVEPLMHRRVRKGKHAHSKQKMHTGKIVYADFIHKTARPIDGSADPHLHVHAFVVNWTHHQGKHFAGEFEEIVRQRPSLQAKFEARLARRLQHELGYNVRRSRFFQSGRLKSGWELDGVDRSTIEKFSRRTKQVEETAQERGITDAAKKGELGKLTREQKETGQSIPQLRSEWRGRLNKQERMALSSLGRSGAKGEPSNEQDRIEKAVSYSLEHHLFRQSTVERHQLVGTALEHGITLSPEAIENELQQRQLIERQVDVDGSNRELLTTREVLRAESEIISYVKDGKGTKKAIGNKNYKFKLDWLNDEQKGAVRHVLESRDSVTGIMGAAGTGKSSLMSEAADAIKRYGKRVYTFAPSTGAREVLSSKGFENAQTVEYLIRNTRSHNELRDQVIWIDEAGLLDTRSMSEVFKIAKQQNARVVFSGDTRQHSSPRRGEAMRLLEREAKLSIAHVTDIQRQKGDYRAAVEMIGKGRDVVNAQTGKTGLLTGFDMLDAMGKIIEIKDQDRVSHLASSYVNAQASDRSTLVVSPTHLEAGLVTEAIRSQLRDAGKLSADECEIEQLRSLNLSEAEKGHWATYREMSDLVIQYHQNAKNGITRGERFRVLQASEKGLQVRSMKNNSLMLLPLTQSSRFEVYQRGTIQLAIGDKLRFTLGGKDKSGKKRISNGRLDQIEKFDRQGHLILASGLRIDRDFGHLDLGYVVTSHASQGKDAKLAIASMGSESLAAMNAKQFYVTVSRGSDDVEIYVDDKQRVRRAIARSGEQLSATELSALPATRSTAGSEEPHHRNSVWHRGRVAIQSFRERLSRWLESRETNSPAEQAIGRHREAALGQMIGMQLTPSLDRSR